MIADCGYRPFGRPTEARRSPQNVRALRGRPQGTEGYPEMHPHGKGSPSGGSRRMSSPGMELARYGPARPPGARF